MPNFLIVAHIALMTALTNRLPEDRERGQGTLEYVGIVIIAGILVAAVVAGLGDGGTITDAISTGIEKVTGAGG